jgi:predicted ribosome quality control (RQC) complex YloA/Tae2 family protein
MAAGPRRSGRGYFTMAVAELRTTYNRAFILRVGKDGREAIGLELAELNTGHWKLLWSHKSRQLMSFDNSYARLPDRFFVLLPSLRPVWFG